MHPHLRPLSFGEILDGAFTLYRRNFLRFFGASVAYGVALMVVAAVVGGAGRAIAGVGGFLGFLVTLVVMVAVVAAAMAMWSALTWLAGRAYTGQQGSLGDAVEASMESAMNLVGVALMAMALLVAISLPGVAIAIPLTRVGSGVAGVLLSVVWVLGAVALVGSLMFAALPAVVLEERGPMEAMNRSYQLASGALGHVAGVMVVALLITALPGMGVEALTGGFRDFLNPAAAAPDSLLEQLVGWMLNLLTAPFFASVIVLLYYDRRVRTEALDVQMMADRLAVAGD